MAAGRHGGYRGNVFRDREMDLEVSSRHGFYCHREEYGHHSAAAGDLKRDRRELLKKGDYRDRARFWRKDVKERQSMNSEYQSSVSASRTGGRRKSLFSLRATEREPGELSSESGSDDIGMSEIQGGHIQNWRMEKPILPPCKKSKFSSLGWDIEEKKEGISLLKRIDSPDITMPPLNRREFSQSLSIEKLEVAESSLIPHSSFQAMDLSISKSPDTQDLSQMNVSVLPNGSLLASPPELLQENHHEPQQIEEESCFPGWNIASSRWADDGNSSCDEVGISDDGNLNKRRKKTTVGDSGGGRVNTNVSSPESGEIVREGSKGASSKSSSSGGNRIGCKDEYSEINSDVNGEVLDEYISSCHAQPVVYENNLPKSPEPSSRSMLNGCRSVCEFEKLNRINEGTYGIVFRAKDKKSGEIVALKKMKMEDGEEGFPLTALREINILLSCHHPSIVNVKEVVVGSTLDSVFIVMEYMEHDLKGLMEMRNQHFSQSEVKCLMFQLLEGVKYLHDNWVIHRDLKTSNILMNNHGELKICDFGLARLYGSPLKPYTPLVVTLWYRAPELLLGAKEYSTAVDMWSVGCIMAELLAREPLFNGKTELDQLGKIFRILGTPSERAWLGYAKLPGVKANFVKQPYNKLREKFPPTTFSGRPTISDAGFDLLNKLLTYDPDKRITAEAALNHDWFREVPLPKSKEFMPTYPPQHDHDRWMQRSLKISDPLEALRKKGFCHGDSGLEVILEDIWWIKMLMLVLHLEKVPFQLWQVTKVHHLYRWSCKVGFDVIFFGDFFFLGMQCIIFSFTLCTKMSSQPGFPYENCIDISPF